MNPFLLLILITSLLVGCSQRFDDTPLATPTPPSILKDNPISPTDDVDQQNSDGISQLLDDLQEQTEIDFSKTGVTKVDWNIEGETEGKILQIEKVSLAGKSFSAQRVAYDKTKAIEAYFSDNGFEIDQYNVADGTVGGAIGYKNESTICMVVSGLSDGAEGIDQENPEFDITVSCATYKSDDNYLTREEAMMIAQDSSCTDEGSLSDEIIYNEFTKTWWIDMTDTNKPGCNPACVVSEESQTAEINWRCTGLVPQE
jgi:hypothetical protein